MDTRDLIERRDELKQQVLDFFLTDFPQYEEMTESYEDILLDEEEIQSWKEDWQGEIDEIERINNLEDEIGAEPFEWGTYLIEEDSFEDYIEDYCDECGIISKDLVHWVVIDWEATANNVKQDYSEVEYDGRTYYYQE